MAHMHSSSRCRTTAAPWTAGSTSIPPNTITIGVRIPVANEAPVAQDDAATTVADVSVILDVLANDTDANGDSLTLASVTGANGSVVIGDANADTIPDLLYTPNPGFVGFDNFSYAIDDGNGGTDTAEVTVVVAQEVAADPGTPLLTGHSGPDRFIYHLGDGPVTITDFEPGTPGSVIDQIQLVGFGTDFTTLDSNADGQLSALDDSISGSSSLTIDFGNDDTLTVANVTVLHEDDLLLS
jgi:Bacterial Ig domain